MLQFNKQRYAIMVTNHSHDRRWEHLKITKIVANPNPSIKLGSLLG